MLRKISLLLLYRSSYYSTARGLCQTTMTGRGLKDVVEVLESVAPLQLAESWDNVGLLIEPSSPHVVARLMLTNDLKIGRAHV